MKICVLLCLVIFWVSADALSSSNPHDAKIAISRGVSRASFMTTIAATCTSMAFSAPAFAKDVDPALRGTKKDPSFEACLSKCMYETTKPKGAEQRPRSECLPECREKCATSKAQLMKGDPKE